MGKTKHLDCKRAVARGAGRAESGMEARTGRCLAELDFQEAMRLELRRRGRGAGQQREESSLISPCSNDEGGWLQKYDASRQRGSQGLAPRGLPGTAGNPCFAGTPTSQLPSRPTSAKAVLGGQKRPHLLERPRDARPDGTHPTATRRQRLAGRTMSASQAAANRPSGDPGPGDAGPSCKELHSERSAEFGS